MEKRAGFIAKNSPKKLKGSASSSIVKGAPNKKKELVFEQLYMESKEKKERMDKVRQEHQIKKMKEVEEKCTFRPNRNPSIERLEIKESRNREHNLTKKQKKQFLTETETEGINQEPSDMP